MFSFKTFTSGTFKEMQAFFFQGFILGKIYPLRVCFDWNRHIIVPLDVMREKQKLVRPVQRVIEYRHFAFTDYHQLLFLGRVPPGDENMGLESAMARSPLSSVMRLIAG
jgi:hypothetical protein